MVKRIVLFFVGFFAMASAMAQTPLSADEQQRVMSQIVEATAAVRVMTADFVQTRRSSMLAQPAVSRGSMRYERPDRLRWEYSEPRKGGIEVVGDSIATIGADAKSAGKANRMMRAMSTMLLNSMNGNKMFDQRIFSTYITSDRKQYCATLTPKRRDMQRMFQSMVFFFDAASLRVKRVSLAEKNGETIIEFSNIATQQ